MKFDFTDKIKQKTDQELTEIFINAKDYNPDFVQLAEQELQFRNINIDTPKQIKETAELVDRQKLEQGKAGSPLYIFFCFVLALLGGLIGIYAGYIYSQSKTKTDDGEVFYVYDEDTRQFGRIMMWFGIACFLFLLIRRLLF